MAIITDMATVSVRCLRRAQVGLTADVGEGDVESKTEVGEYVSAAEAFGDSPAAGSDGADENQSGKDTNLSVYKSSPARNR